MIARLTLQHEFERMATARAENVALEFAANSELMQAMEASKEAYGAEGEKAKKTSGDHFKGHPEGKKPDAMFKMLAIRLAALVEKQKKELDGAVGALKEQYQETAQRALQTMLITGMQAEKDKDMRAKRCFDVKYKDGQKQCIKWILAAPAHSEFMHALNVLKQTRIMEAVQIKVEETDRATMSKAAKDIRDALKAGGSGGWLFFRPKEAPKEVNRGRAQQEFGCAPRQNVGRDSLERVLRGEPHRGQVRSPQRSSSPGPGRCKLGFSHHLQVPLSERDMQAECGGWHSSTKLGGCCCM